MSHTFCRCGAAFGWAYGPGSKKTYFNEMESTSNFMDGIRQTAMLVKEALLPSRQKRPIKT